MRDGARDEGARSPVRVVAIPQTPFDDADRIDLDSFARGVADRLAAGVDGLLYPVVASEVGQLTDAERRTLTCAILDQAATAVPVIVGASADDPTAARDLASFAIEHGAAGVLVQAPVALLRDESADGRLLPDRVRGADRTC
jgi:4-hydroxy-tetrahydrodipicolinate synthase